LSSRQTIAEVVAVAAVLMILLAARWVNLEADPPENLARSTSVLTDPAQYVHYARQYVETGDINPYEDFRQPFFLQSSVTVVALAVFRAFGTGLWQANFVGLLFSFASLVLFYLFVRRMEGRVAGLLFLALVGMNYNLLFFGRLPFLEHAMQFWVMLALVLLAYSRRTIAYLAAGMSLAVGIFFGKIIGLIFLAPVACFLVYRALFESDVSDRRRWWPSLTFAGGFGVVSVFWWFFGYLTMPEQVSGYVSEQALDLYGAPYGLTSLYGFFDSLATFGEDSKLLGRMSTVSITGCGLLGIFLFHFVRRKSWRSGFGWLRSEHVFVATGIISFFGALMIWNYRPLRYELPLIYFFGAAAAVVLARLWRIWGKPSGNNTPWLFYLALVPVFIPIVWQVTNGMYRLGGSKAAFEDHSWMVLAVAVFLAALTGSIVRLYLQDKLPCPQTLGKLAVIAVVVGVVGRSGADYVDWLDRATFTLRDNSQDIAQNLAGSAVLSGPYGPAVAQTVGMSAVIHMFGGVRTDSTLFERFPVTHLLLDESNEERAREEYPQMMENAAHVCTYHFSLEKIRLFRIAGATENALASSYQPGEVERAVDLRTEHDLPEAATIADQFSQRHPGNIVANLLLADMLEQNGDLEAAESYLKKAVEFSPTNYNLNATLAILYSEQFDRTGQQVYKTNGIKYFREAVRLAPRIAKLRMKLAKLEDDKSGR
jgi:4-amino-4-deoxy-L-arabinose transferase-like glycosyltransferase